MPVEIEFDLSLIVDNVDTGFAHDKHHNGFCDVAVQEAHDAVVLHRLFDAVLVTHLLTEGLSESGHAYAILTLSSA